MPTKLLLKNLQVVGCAKSVKLSGPEEQRGRGKLPPPQMGLADQLTLCQSWRGADYAHQIII